MIDESRVEREDITLFVNAAFTCSAQHEYYGSATQQRVSVAFLHAYVAGNYRRMYARCLAIGVNHHNAARVVYGLLAAGAPTDPDARAEENDLIRATLRALPPPVVYRLFTRLRRHRVNNRRTRATMKAWLAARPKLPFDAVKYRKHLRSMVRHAHVPLEDEPFAYLFQGAQSRRQWTDPLFDAVRRSRYEEGALYELPFSIAEGLAASKGIPRARFLARAEASMTARERLRVQATAKRVGAKVGAVSLDRMGLTRLCSYVLGLPREEREARREEIDRALQANVAHSLIQSPLRLPRVAAVLDRSTSSRGSGHKRNRPLAVTWGVHRLLAAASASYAAFWTWPTTDELRLGPRGQTDLATPLLAALRTRPDLLVVVSDGYDNAPPGAAAAILSAFRQRLDPERCTQIVHVNPVFDANDLQPRTLGPAAPTVGVRDAEDLPTMLGFARFVEGVASLADLHAYLDVRVAHFLERYR